MTFERISKVLAGLLLTVTIAQADLTADFHGIKGNADLQSKAFLKKIDAVGFQWAGNDNIQIPYFKKFKDKNLDLLSFFTVTNLDVMRELLLKNPDFGAYAPYNMLFYKFLEEKEKTTWFGHLDSDLMLNIIGEKDEANRKTFKDMVASLDEVAMKELKPTESKKLEYTNKLPAFPLTKMVMKLPTDLKDADAISEWTEEWIETHDGAFVAKEFIIAGFLDFKLEYDDAEQKFDKYDAYWVSSLCHFKFSNGIFNHGEPQAGLFAPCSIYFYVPKGSGELHVGYSQVGNWLATTGIKDEAMKKRITAIDVQVVDTFKGLGFELVDQAKK
jgi:uncharacterized protein (DUF302 family)